MQQILIFANPISGRGRGRKIADRLARRLTDEGYSVALFLKHADEIRDDELPADARAAIIIGGDGTLRTVAARFMWGSINRNDPSSDLLPPILLVPMGTANLMGKHLGIAWDPRHVDHQVLHVLRTGRVVQVDTATANGQLLLIVAGVGLDAHVVHEIDRRRSGPISYFSYVVPTLMALGQYDYPPLAVTVDDNQVFGPAPATVFIGNIPEYGTGFPLLPLASPTDGLLDVCVLPARSREELFSHVLRAAAGEHLFGEDVVYVKGRHIRVESLEAVPVQIDGEAAGHTPLDIDLLPTRLAFIVP